ncbi:MAG: ABC transporter ATP-binding protein [Polaromonas sp. 39-63-203]|nr:MAG: ABC transporter ATP-binding protein [Polaromonas sp. 35-63-240]OYZ01060.1 MAG: ABC transporter ATP-binding protein [Polaromonas sp. 28-63-22]OYZ83927.1 MAG: ABC transporter ATP-binding protein [Polaromonas sp. 24-62-144]OZB01257.1 MAG: ABC transporter ATP-binding protein [Polaromonas sp. 39-63-203]
MASIHAFDLYRFFHNGDAETLALRGVSLMVAPGEMVALLGASGSGKSTLLNCLAGLDEPDGGHVDLLGERLTRRPEAERARRRGASIGILMQAHNLIPALRLVDNMALAMRLAGKTDHARAMRLFEQLGLGGHMTARPAQLSGGEVARAGLAIALAASPQVLLADEPTGEVDAATETRVLDVFNAQRAAGTAIVIATHSEALASHADRVVRMHDGRINHD